MHSTLGRVAALLWRALCAALALPASAATITLQQTAGLVIPAGSVSYRVGAPYTAHGVDMSAGTRNAEGTRQTNQGLTYSAALEASYVRNFDRIQATFTAREGHEFDFFSFGLSGVGDTCHMRSGVRQCSRMELAAFAPYDAAPDSSVSVTGGGTKFFTVRLDQFVTSARVQFNISNLPACAPSPEAICGDLYTFGVGSMRTRAVGLPSFRMASAEGPGVAALSTGASDVAPVPLPAGGVLLMAALVGLAVGARRAR